MVTHSFFQVFHILVIFGFKLLIKKHSSHQNWQNAINLYPQKIPWKIAKETIIYLLKVMDKLIFLIYHTVTGTFLLCQHLELKIIWKIICTLSKDINLVLLMVLSPLNPSIRCIFSILFSIHFLRCCHGEFVEWSRAALVSDYFFSIFVTLMCNVMSGSGVGEIRC